MPKKIFNALGYRAGSGMPEDAGLGCELMQTCNRGFYATDSTGKFLWNKQPDWDTYVEDTLSKIDPNKSVYFDLEQWLCNATDPAEILQQKLYSAILLNRFKRKYPTFSKTVGCYGYPSEDMNPMNPASATEAWKAKVATIMNGGEISNYLNSGINAIFPSFYPGEFTGTDKITDSLSWQFKFNQIVLDTVKANNKNNYPIYGFFSPRIRLRKDGLYYLIDYKMTYAHVNWILTNCDGIVLWDWDGYGDPAKSVKVLTWDVAITMPWYQAIKDCISVFNGSPNVNGMINNLATKFPDTYSAI
jgi:hypothetical protein